MPFPVFAKRITSTGDFTGLDFDAAHQRGFPCVDGRHHQLAQVCRRDALV
jgi:hypothetical protein